MACSWAAANTFSATGSVNTRSSVGRMSRRYTAKMPAAMSGKMLRNPSPMPGETSGPCGMKASRQAPTAPFRLVGVPLPGPLDGVHLQVFLGAEVREQPALAHG